MSLYICQCLFVRCHSKYYHPCLFQAEKDNEKKKAKQADKKQKLKEKKEQEKIEKQKEEVILVASLLQNLK